MKNLNLKAIDNSLFFYGGLVTFALIGIAVVNLQSTTSIIALILFLPVAVYFLFRMLSQLYHFFHHQINTRLTRHPYFEDFSLATFLSQNETSFLINLVLLSVAIFLIFFRISTQLIK